MKFFVYVLYSETANLHYTGFTNNLPLRLLSHNTFGKGWTKKYRLWKLIFSKEFDAKSDATQYEKWLKTGQGRMFITNLVVD